MDKEKFLSEKNENFIIRVNNDNLIENIQIFDINNNQVNLLEVEHFKSDISIKSSLDFSTSNFAFNFSKIICHLKNGMLLVYSNSFQERTSRDGVDMSTDYHSTKLINLNSLKFDFISLKKDRFGNSEKNVGEFYGIFCFKMSVNNKIAFNVFDNLIISNCISNKYIVYASEIKIQEILQILDINVNPSLKEQYSLIREKSVFTLTDIDFTTLINNASLFDILEFLSNEDLKIQEYFAVLKTIDNAINKRYIIEFTNKIISIERVPEYLLKNDIKYNKTKKPIKCLTRTLPCMCFVRDKDCLFIDVFEKLTEKNNHFLDEKYLETELLNYAEIENDNEKIKIWLIKNLQIGLSKLNWFSTANKYSNLKLSFINGKNDTEFEYIKFQIDGNDFKNNYDFAHLFCDLFFEKELLPNELAKWKYENEITE